MIQCSFKKLYFGHDDGCSANAIIGDIEDENDDDITTEDDMTIIMMRPMMMPMMRPMMVTIMMTMIMPGILLLPHLFGPNKQRTSLLAPTFQFD